METVKLKLVDSSTYLDGGTILLGLQVDNHFLSLKLDRYLGSATPDHLYIGDRCLKPYCETEKRIIDVLDKHIHGLSGPEESAHIGRAQTIIDACRKEGRSTPFGFDDRDSHTGMETLLGSLAILGSSVIEKHGPKIADFVQSMFVQAKKRDRRSKQKCVPARPRRKKK